MRQYKTNIPNFTRWPTNHEWRRFSNSVQRCETLYTVVIVSLVGGVKASSTNHRWDQPHIVAKPSYKTEMGEVICCSINERKQLLCTVQFQFLGKRTTILFSVNKIIMSMTNNWYSNRPFCVMFVSDVQKCYDGCSHLATYKMDKVYYNFTAIFFLK